MILKRIFYIWNVLHLMYFSFHANPIITSNKQLNSFKNLSEGFTQSFDVYTEISNFGPQLHRKQISVTYNGINRYYLIKEIYNFCTPDVSMICRCECPDTNSFSCTIDTVDRCVPCPTNYQNSIKCFPYFNEGKQKGCKYGYQAYCQTIINPVHQNNKEYKALYINQPVNTISLTIQTKSLLQHDAHSLTLDVPISISRILVDSNIVVEILKSKEKQFINETSFVPSTYYYILLDDANKILNKEKINSLDSVDMHKLGWFRYDKSADKINDIDKNVFRASLKFSLIKCTETPEFIWDLDATNYYKDGVLKSPPQGISLLDRYNDIIRDVMIEEKNGFVVTTQKSSPIISLKIYTTAQKQNMISFLAQFVLNKKHQNVLILKFSENFSRFEGKIVIIGKKNSETPKNIVIDNSRYEHLVSYFYSSAWVCLRTKESEEICRLAEFSNETFFGNDFSATEVPRTNTQLNNNTVIKNLTTVENIQNSISHYISTALFPTITVLLLLIIFGLVIFFKHRLKNQNTSNLNECQTDEIEMKYQNETILETTKENQPLLSEDTFQRTNISQEEPSDANLKTFLKEKYASLKLPLFSWFKQMELNFIDSFISPTMHVHSLNNETESKEECLEFSDIFKILGDAKYKRIVVVGEPGIGKTSLARKLAYDWAIEKTYMIEKFELVLLISLRNIHSTLDDVIKREIREEFSTILGQNQKILLILDGYDQMNVDHKKHVLPIIFKEKYPELTVIVTSRYEQNLFSDDFLPLPETRSIPWDSRICLKGLSADRRKEFIKNNFKIDDHIFQQNNNIADLMKNPFYFHIFLSSIISNKQLASIKTKTNIYLRIFTYMISRNFNILIKNIDLISPKTKQFYLELLELFGKLQINCSSKGKFIYTKKEILEACNGDSRIFSMGFLKPAERYRELNEEEFYEPVHVIFVQFCAAYYIWIKYKENEKQLQDEISQLIENNIKPENSSVIYPCLAGLLEENAFKLFDILITDLSTNDYRACTFDGKHHKFSPIINMINECRLKKLNLQSIKRYLPRKWEILQKNEFYSSNLHADLLDIGMRSEIVHELCWNTEISPTFPSKLTLQTLKIKTEKDFPNLFDAFTKLKEVKCEELNLEILHLDHNNINYANGLVDIIKQIINIINCRQFIINLPNQQMKLLKIHLEETTKKKNVAFASSCEDLLT